MSNYIQDFYDYNLVKKRKKCKNIQLKSNFNEQSAPNDRLHSDPVEKTLIMKIETKAKLVIQKIVIN